LGGATLNKFQANECVLASVQTAQAEPGYVGLLEQKQLLNH